MTTTHFSGEIERVNDLLVKLCSQLDGPINNYNTLEASVLSDGALERKTKELMMLAVVIARGDKESLGFYVQKAIKAGACRAEVLETIGVSVLAGGSSARITGALALEAFNQIVGVGPDCEGNRVYGP